MLAVAVTGGIGSGKSTVSARLGELGAVVVDSDQLARQAVGVGTEGLREVAECFGDGVIAADGSLDRAALARIVFSDAAARARLEAITHPRVRAAFRARAAAAGPGALVVNDIPLLTSIDAAAEFHLVIGVDTPLPMRVERLIGRGMPEADAQARIAAQISDTERNRLIDVRLTNEGSLDRLLAQVDSLWADRLLPFQQNLSAAMPAARPGPTLAATDTRWPDRARLLAARVSRAAGSGRVDHIGSTAVPGLPAKDVIDLQLSVSDLAEADQLASALAAAGFVRVAAVVADTPHPPDDDRARWTKRLHVNCDPGQGVNLHVRVKDWPNWRWALLVRDWLRADAGARGEYLVMKERVAAAHAGDAWSAGYAAAKEPWFADAAPRAEQWARATGWAPAPGGG